MSGHSKWANIKHHKGVQDAKRSKVFTRIAKAIIIAVQNGGDDIEINSNLKLAIEQAKKANMPKDNIERAIKRGKGGTDEGAMEEIVYEAYFPTSKGEMIAMMIVCATDNKNRTVSEIKSFLKKNNGKFVPNGSVSFQFEEVGQFIIETDNLDVAELDLIEVGVKDLERVEKEIIAFTDKSEVQKIYNEIEQKGYQAKDLQIVFRPKQILEIDEETAEAYGKLYEIIDEQDDVQEIFDNIG